MVCIKLNLPRTVEYEVPFWILLKFLQKPIFVSLEVLHTIEQSTVRTQGQIFDDVLNSDQLIDINITVVGNVIICRIQIDDATFPTGSIH